MKELMLSSIGRRVEYQFGSDGTVTRSDGGSYQMFGDHFKRGSKTYFHPHSPVFGGLRPKEGFLVDADIRYIGTAPDHVEYYVTGSQHKILEYLATAKTLGHEIAYPSGFIMPSVSVPNSPMLSFTFKGNELVEVCIYMAMQL